MLEKVLCEKCERLASIELQGKFFCSIHALEEQARIEPTLIKKAEEEILKGIPKANKH